MLRSSWRDYSDTYILVIGTTTVAEVSEDRENNGIQVVLKNFAPFTNCISKIKNITMIIQKHQEAFMTIL